MDIMSSMNQVSSSVAKIILSDKIIEIVSLSGITWDEQKLVEPFCDHCLAIKS